MASAAYLVLENGAVFEGQPFGAPTGEGRMGEVVFTTGMTGYLETLTDPSYYGQIVVQTFPLIGNYGVITPDFESAALHLKGYVVKECCEHPSNFRSEGTLGALLADRGVVGICGVDTRALTKIIREAGVMNGTIVCDPDKADLTALGKFSAAAAVASVSTKEVNVAFPEKPQRRVVLWDFGVKQNIVRCLTARGCEVVTVPHSYSAEQITACNPDGVMLSNGPGDPTENAEVVAELGKLLSRGLPTFGICLGHQLLALAMGARTEKLKYGHRGGNQPVKDVQSGSVAITTQNHGYAVVAGSIPQDVARMRYVNANDGTCEGIDYLSVPAFSVQFHPEAAAGPMDTAFLFDRFVSLMEEKKHAVK